jgi:hypothetical protein
MSNKTKICLGSILWIAVVTVIGIVWAAARTFTMPVASGPAQITAVMRDDALHDLTRLLKPASYSVPTGPTGNQVLFLSDAIYSGATAGKARLLTVWLGQEQTNDSTLLSTSDATKSASDIANELSQGALASKTFAVMPVEVSWQNWQLKVARVGNSATKGPLADQLLTAINDTSPTIRQVDTRSITIPIGFGLSKPTTWQPWFNPDSVVIEIKPIPIGSVSSSPPDITSLAGRAGFIVGDDFLNNVFSNELKDQFVGTKVGQDSYHAQDLRFAAATGKFVVSGQYVEQPPPAVVRLQAEFGGADLVAERIQLERVDCGTLQPLACAQLKAQVIATGVILTNKIKPNTSIRPPDEQNLGNFFIGSKPLSGIARVDQLQAVDGSVVVVCRMSVRGGHVK